MKLKSICIIIFIYMISLSCTVYSQTAINSIYFDNLVEQSRKKSDEQVFNLLKDSLQDKFLYVKQAKDLARLLKKDRLLFVQFIYDRLIDQETYDQLEALFTRHEDIVRFWEITISKKNKNECLTILNKYLSRTSITESNCGIIINKLAINNEIEADTADVVFLTPSKYISEEEKCYLIFDKIKVKIIDDQYYCETALDIAFAAYLRLQALCKRTE